MPLSSDTSFFALLDGFMKRECGTPAPTHRSPDREQYVHDVGGEVFRAGLWFVAYPSSVDVLPDLRRWRDSHGSITRKMTFQTEELRGKWLQVASPFDGMNNRIRRCGASLLLVADSSHELLHSRAANFVAQLTPFLLGKTVILIPDEAARSQWPNVAPPRVVTLGELDTLLG
jgi:hypothetical protein